MEDIFHYEFGIMIGASEDESRDATALVVIDLRDVSSFWKVRNHTGPEGQIYPSVTNIMLKCGDSMIVYYPYENFKELYRDTLDAIIKKMPYPSL